MAQPIQLLFGLDGDVSWRVRELCFVESLSRPYELSLQLERDTEVPFTSEDADAALGCECSLQIDTDAGIRTVHGKLLELTRLTDKAGELRLHARVVPALALAAHTRRSRTFVEQSVKDVVDVLLREHLVASQRDHEWALSEAYPTRELIIQYRESDLAFMQRLLEEAGVAYHFTPDSRTKSGEQPNAEVLVLDDCGCSFHPVILGMMGMMGDGHGDEAERAPFIDFIDHDATLEGLLEFVHAAQLSIHTVERHVYDWDTEDLEPYTATAEVESGLSRCQADGLRGEVLAARGQGPVATRAQLDLRRYQQQRWTARGRSTVPGFAPGRLFAVADYGTFLLTSVTHRAKCSDNSQTADYINEFECTRIDDSRVKPLRHVPPRLQPKPRMGGPHTALVVGADGGDAAETPMIHTDAKGRVKVRFHWERAADDDGVFAWLRVAQTWSGAGYGFLFVPRVGMEVVVEFLDGDPDAPMIVGCVYNGRQVVAAGGDALSEADTRSWIRTRSEDGVGFNEILFDDAQGRELVHVRAQKDLHGEILNDQTIEIGHDEAVTIDHDQTLAVGNDQTVEIGHDQALTVGNDQSVEIGHDQTLTVGNDQTQKIGRDQTVTVGHDRSATIGNNHIEMIGNDHLETIGNNQSLTVGNSLTETITAGRAQTIGKDAVETVGSSKKLKVGLAMTTTVGSAMTTTVGLAMTTTVGLAMTTTVGGVTTFTSGGNFTIISTSDVSIEGKAKGKVVMADEFLIECGSASLKLEKSGKVTITGTEILMEASGETTIKGSIIKLN